MTTPTNAGSGVARYANVYFKGTGGHHIVEDPEGEYVKYDDYEYLLDLLNRTGQRLAAYGSTSMETALLLDEIKLAGMGA